MNDKLYTTNYMGKSVSLLKKNNSFIVAYNNPTDSNYSFMCDYGDLAVRDIMSEYILLLEKKILNIRRELGRQFLFSDIPKEKFISELQEILGEN